MGSASCGEWFKVLTVRLVRRDRECALLTDTHADEAFVPTSDDLANTNCRVGTDKYLAVKY
jgi:hypothetical protein